MWNLKYFKAENIQTFKEVEYHVNQGVTTLIFGNNKDNPIQPSNGSGKSGIVEIITVGTTGAPMRRVRVDEIINDSASKATTEIGYYNDETDELMVIYRTLYKKSTNAVSLYMERDGVPVPEDEYVQSSSSEYNKFIFDKLGITEAEFLNNFVLSAHRYKSFLDSPDREKKEIINKLSNAILVDEMTQDKLQNDINLTKEKADALNMDLASVNGSVEAIEEQIVSLKEEAKNKTKKEERIAKIKADISERELNLLEKRAALTSEKSTKTDLVKVDDIIASIDEEWEIEEIYRFLQQQHNSSSLGIAAFQFLESMVSKVNVTIASNEAITSNIQECKRGVKQSSERISKYERLIDMEKDKLSNIDDEIEAVKEKYKENSHTLELELAELKESRENISSKISESKKKLSIFEKKVAHLNNVIAGTITCPKCSHKFLLDSDVDVDESIKEKEKLEKTSKAVDEDIESMSKERKGIDEKLDVKFNEQLSINNLIKKEVGVIEKKAKPISDAVDELKNKIDDEKDVISQLESAISSSSRKISRSKAQLIDEMDEEIESALQKATANVNKLEQEVVFLVDSIDTLKDGINDIINSTIDDNIASLESRLLSYKNKRTEINKEYDKVNNDLHKLEEQELLFGNFKTYLANTKIDALSHEINGFLEHIGSDLSLQLDGYTATKSGKVRERISVSVLRDGVDFGSFYKLSEGEKSTIQIATILAQQKLINIGVEDTKGLNLLVVDEILDSVDGGGLSHIFKTINKSGTTSLVVSHGKISENYPHQIIVIKNNGISSVSDLRLNAKNNG